MKKLLSFYLIVIITISLSGCNFWGVRGSGKVKTENRDLANFTELSVGGAFTVNIVSGKEPSFKISAEENLLPLISTSVRGSTLNIKTKKNISPRKEILIEITTKELNEVECSGANNINIRGVNTDNFTIGLSGAGNIKVEGETDRVHARISGAGNINAKNLKSKDVFISVSGAASASVFASNFLDASVSGVGSIDYYGYPQKTNTNVSGVGSISRK